VNRGVAWPEWQWREGLGGIQCLRGRFYVHISVTLVELVRLSLTFETQPALAPAAPSTAPTPAAETWQARSEQEWCWLAHPAASPTALLRAAQCARGLIVQAPPSTPTPRAGNWRQFVAGSDDISLSVHDIGLSVQAPPSTPTPRAGNWRQFVAGSDDIKSSFLSEKAREGRVARRARRREVIKERHQRQVEERARVKALVGAGQGRGRVGQTRAFSRIYVYTRKLWAYNAVRSLYGHFQQGEGLLGLAHTVLAKPTGG